MADLVSIFREGWLEAFIEMRGPRTALSRHFTVKRGGIYRGERVSLDIQRFGEEVAIPVTRCKGPNLNDVDEFTTKTFRPPSYGEAIPMDVCDLLDRMVGVDPYSAEGIEYSAQLMAYMIKGFRQISDKIVRAIELQAAQILQTAKLTLTDEEGGEVYTLDFLGKATHFPTTSVSWSDHANADVMGDLENLAATIRADGKVNVDTIYMGSTAFRNAKRNQEFKDCLDNRRMSVGEINPMFLDSGVTRQGTLWVGDYEFTLLTYPETYNHPETGATTKYLEDDKVVMISTKTRMDMTFAKVPLPLGPDPRVAHLMPGRVSSMADNIDMTPNLWCTPNGKQIMGELESRPLLMPVQIDGYGCLDTEI